MLALALVLDALIGEPRVLWSRVPHPVVAMGRVISFLDERLNQGNRRRAKGVVALLILLLVVLPVPILVAWLPYAWPIEMLGAAVLLAHRSLVDHVGQVARGLARSLAEGREAVSLIVGRDPDSLDAAGVSRAAIESAAENFSDGVVAPAFWFAVAGLPGIAAYKAVNTADSMIGHLSPRYAAFGWASARLDDVLNWVPARLAGVFICLAGGVPCSWAVMLRDARRHRSPNAGWPETAMAASLGVALAGPRVYGDRIVDDPYLNADGRRDPSVADIDRAVWLLWRTWAIILGMAATLGFLRLVW